MAWEAIATGVRLAGAIHAVLLAVYAALALRPAARAFVPVGYAACLLGALLVPVLTSPGLRGLAAALWLALPALTYLLVLQLTDDAPPGRRHLAVLAVPLVALPEVVALAGGLATIELYALRVPVQPALQLYAVLTGAGVLALVFVVRRARLTALASSRADRHRYALVLAILGMQAVALGIALLAMGGLVPGGRAELATAVVEVTMLYLVGSALFRLPAAPVPDTHAVAPAAEPDPGAADSKAPGPLTERERALLKTVQARMEQDALYRDHTLSRRDLADTLGVPEHQITRVLNAGLGQSFTRFVNGCRVAEARTLLTTCDLQITEIAFRVGFNSLATFNRVFKEIVGTTPRAYRNRGNQFSVSATA